MDYSGTGAPAVRLLGCVAALGAAALAAEPAAASVVDFEGQRVEAQEFQEPLGIVAVATATVGSGVEFDDFGTFLNFDIDFGATTIDLISNVEIPAQGGLSFGFNFLDADGAISEIVDVFVIGNPDGYTGLVSDSIRPINGGAGFVIDFDGVGVTQGAELNLGVMFRDSAAVIPLPATLPLALAGFGALAALGRRRRAG